MNSPTECSDRGGGSPSSSPDLGEAGLRRLCLGWLAALLSPGLVFGMIHSRSMPHKMDLLDYLIAAAMYGAAGIIVTLPTFLVFGLPLSGLFQKHAWRRWWQYVLGGVAGTWVCMLVFLLECLFVAMTIHLAISRDRDLSMTGGIIRAVRDAPYGLCTAIGAFSGLTLWLCFFASHRTLLVVSGFLGVSLIGVGLLG